MAMDVTTPGATVPKGKTGVLQADLSCSPVTVGIYLENGAKLDMVPVCTAGPPRSSRCL